MGILAAQYRVNADEISLPVQRLEVMSYAEQIRFWRQPVGRVPPVTVGEQAELTGIHKCLQGRVLNEAQVPDGNSHMWSITVNPKLRLNRRGNFDPYVVGGVGYYRRTVEFTRPVLVPVFIFDPFFGGFFNTFVQADQVLGRITQDGVGGSAGAGFDVKLGETGLKFFTEARYHYADTGRIPTRMVPVTFGIRW